MLKKMKHHWAMVMSVALLLCGCEMISDSGFATVEATPESIFSTGTSNSWRLKLQANEDGVIVKSLKINNGACEVSSEEIERANERFSKKAGGIWNVAVLSCVGGIQTLEVHTNRGANAFELSYSR